MLFGIGDDAAVVRQAGRRDTVVTVDLLVEDVDFRLATTTPEFLGHKALAVSLSDIAAMGARPRWAMLSLGVPRNVWRSPFPDRFYEGFFALADRYDVSLIGGDVSRTPARVVLDSILMGETERGRAVFRGGARAGDHIFVTGSLGGAALGLKLLEYDRDAVGRGAGRMRSGAAGLHRRVVERLILRQLRPEPRVSWGLVLGEERLATAMIDLSDGLSSDLAHLCRESRVGALVDAERIPVDVDAARVCERLALDPLRAALDGGEDFELLFTVRPRNLARLPKSVGGVPATYIGDVTPEENRIRLRTGARSRDLKPGGFTHFR